MIARRSIVFLELGWEEDKGREIEFRSSYVFRFSTPLATKIIQKKEATRYLLNCDKPALKVTDLLKGDSKVWVF